MEENKYKLAGWLAVGQAVLFPAAVVIGIIEAVVAGGIFHIRRPFLGPSDLLMVLFTGIAIYTLIMFRRLLHERYNFHELDILIIISIWWAIGFLVVNVGLTLLAMIFWPIDSIIMAIVLLVYMTASMVSIGIVDILIAIKLLNVKERFSEHIRNFAYVNMAAGICEVTVFLSLLSLVLIPISSIILALVFFRDQQEVEFV